MTPRRRPDDVDDYSRFDRPSRRSRPRTKQRPRHDDAVEGFVVRVDRGRFTCLLDDDRQVVAMRARTLRRDGVVVGDQVRLVGDLSGQDGTLARIVGVAPRETALRRTADDQDPVERVIVANADQLVIVTALADPPPRPRLIDRCLVAAYDGGLDPLLCLTKSDLASPDDLIASYSALHVPYVVTRHDANQEANTTPLYERLRERVSVLVGHSGVGKSTLVNTLIPGANRAVGEVSEATGRGRHISTQAIALRLAAGGWVIDTPGLRSFGLAHVDPDRLLEAFGDLKRASANCPRGCTHLASEPECALDEEASAGHLENERVASYRRLLASRTSDDHP